jgi:hypothetical protein
VTRVLDFQVAEPEERAEPYRPNATVLYTGQSRTAATGIASLLLSSTRGSSPPSANATALAADYLARSSPGNPTEACSLFKFCSFTFSEHRCLSWGYMMWL